jgi:hypothetical protein
MFHDELVQLRMKIGVFFQLIKSLKLPVSACKSGVHGAFILFSLQQKYAINISPSLPYSQTSEIQDMEIFRMKAWSLCNL